MIDRPHETQLQFRCERCNVKCAHNYAKWDDGYESTVCTNCGLYRRHSSGNTERPFEPEERNVATVNFCERHSGFGKSNVMGAVHYHTEETGQWHKREICPDCVADLIAWMEAGKTLPATHEPYLEAWKPEMPAREPSVTEQVIQRLDRLLANQEADAKKAITNGESNPESPMGM